MIRRSSQRHKNALEVIIDNFGKRSAVAQGLGAVITTMQKLLCSDHRLYIHRSERTVNGILKVGKKHLFIRDASADKMHEIEPMCVLDFYVHESLQKRGIGRQLFDEMLAREKVQPHMLGYDRPSPKLLSFLRKHFSLMDFEPQANNFVVFRSYFRASSSNSKENLHAANVTDRQYRQRSDGNFISSNNFFLGGRGSSHASQHANWSRRGHHGMPPPSAPAVMGEDEDEVVVSSYRCCQGSKCWVTGRVRRRGGSTIWTRSRSSREAVSSVPMRCREGGRMSTISSRQSVETATRM
uniref:Alpha-tubulin N-acetyltransferase n=1 Tax=Guillardia theta (strain CCMP2712) TaxID=905079 RepID=A0A0C3TIA6_GUITC